MIRKGLEMGAVGVSELDGSGCAASEVTKVSDSFVDELVGLSTSCPDDCQLRMFCSLFAVAVRASAAELGWRSVGDSIRFVLSLFIRYRHPSSQRSCCIQCSSAVHRAPFALLASLWRSVEVRVHERTRVTAHLAAARSAPCRPLAPAPPPVAGHPRSADASRSAPAFPGCASEQSMSESGEWRQWTVNERLRRGERETSRLCSSRSGSQSPMRLDGTGEGVEGDAEQCRAVQRSATLIGAVRESMSRGAKPEPQAFQISQIQQKVDQKQYQTRLILILS